MKALVDSQMFAFCRTAFSGRLQNCEREMSGSLRFEGRFVFVGYCWHDLGRHSNALWLWFLAMWLIASEKNGISAKGAQRQLGFTLYETIWVWLPKLSCGEPWFAPAETSCREELALELLPECIESRHF